MRLQTLREAIWIFLVLAALLSLSFAFLPWLAPVWALLILFSVYFFRDPDRAVPSDPAAVVAAADGVVVDITEVVEPEVVKTTMTRISIFLSVFDVHTNRAPVSGKVIYSERHVGKFLDARHPDATRLNEFRTWGFENPGCVVVVRQITGAIARRIVAWSKVGDALAKGDRFGMIRFGSRTEIYLPPDALVTAKVGDVVKGGATVIARLSLPSEQKP